MSEEIIGYWQGLPVYLTEHARIRIRERGITINDLKEALNSPDMDFLNKLYNRRIIVKLYDSEGLILVLDEFEDHAEIVTVIFSTEAREIVRRRTRRGRWA